MAIRYSEGKAPECEKCHKRFSSKNRHDAHIKTIHENDVVKPFICDKCIKSFRTKDYLNNHKRTKHQINQSYCAKCDKTSESTQQLTQHLNNIHVVNFVIRVTRPTNMWQQ